jgi:hypothetical protein
VSDFDVRGAILSYVRARGTAPEDDIIRALEAKEEDAVGDEPHDSPDVGNGQFWTRVGKVPTRDGSACPAPGTMVSGGERWDSEQRGRRDGAQAGSMRERSGPANVVGK